MTVENAYKSPYRWIVLLVFTLVAGVSQMLWLNFAPLISLLQQKYGVSEFTASLPTLVFPLLYVIFSIPAGLMTDKKGYKFTVGLGAVLMALFSCLRVFDFAFWPLMLGQIGIAVGQPFVVNGISKLVADWFDREQGAIATGLGTVGMFLGMAVAMAATPPLVSSMGLGMSMAVFAGISVILAIAFLVLAKENRTHESIHLETISIADCVDLMKEKHLLILFAIAFLALGFFNGLMTLIEPILGEQKINAEDAGMIGGLLIFGGIAGAIVIPALSDKFKKRKPFLVSCAVFALALTYPLSTGNHFTTLAILGFSLGFFFLPGYALLLEMSEELAGEKRAGSATGLLMLLGNAGGVVVVIAMEAVKGQNQSWLNSIYLMLGLLAMTIVLTLLVPETFRKKA